MCKFVQANVDVYGVKWNETWNYETVLVATSVRLFKKREKFKKDTEFILFVTMEAVVSYLKELICLHTVRCVVSL